MRSNAGGHTGAAAPNPSRARPRGVRLGRSLRHCLYAALGVAIGAPFLAQASGERTSAPLDDAFIHLMYARSLAEGHPFAYHLGEAPSSGASSVLWVVLLAPFEAIFGPPSATLAIALLLGCALIGLAIGAITDDLLEFEGRTEAIGGALVLVGWGWLGWHGASGMEVGLAAAAVCGVFHLTRRYVCAAPTERARLAWPLLALACALPWIRPESAPFAGVVGLLVLLRPHRGRHRWRALGLLPWSSTLAIPVFWWLITGTSRTNGTTAKWVFANPYFNAERLATGTQVRLHFFWDFLTGTSLQEYPLGFFPPWVMAAALPFALVPLFRARRARLGGWLLLLATLGTFGALLTLATFHGHRYRYLVPYLLPLLAYAGAGLVTVTRAAMRSLYTGRRRALALAAPLGLALSVAWVSWPGALEHYRRACQEIRHQHLELAMEIRRLPGDAIIAVNDAGALAYLGGRRTHDLVGLTTNGAAVPYLLGRGSLHEQLESTPPKFQPSHFAVHARWFPMPHLLGEELASRSVPLPMAIVGGETLELRVADLSSIGGGEQPLTPDLGARIDSLDVADVADETGHEHHLSERDWEDQLLTLHQTVEGEIWEGGWLVRGAQSFVLRGAPNHEVRLLLRTDGPVTGDVRPIVDGEELGAPRESRFGGWLELEWVIPAERSRSQHRVVIEREERQPLRVYHWWTYRS